MIAFGSCSVAWPCIAGDTSHAAVQSRVVDAVCDKDIVLLGELPSHGEAQAFAMKARIARELVERCGFDGIAFEAPIYDFIGFEDQVRAGTTQPAQLDNAIGRFWSSQELAEWRQWMYANAARGRLRLSGLDDQLSATSEHARAALPTLIGDALPADTAAVCSQAVVRHVNWRYGPAHPFDAAEKQRLQQCVRSAADALAGRAAATASERIMVDNLLHHVGRQAKVPGARQRDDSMRANLLWQLDRMPEGSKLVVWTSTVHAARKQGGRSYTPLGARLVEHSRHRVASIGFTALAGTSSMAGMPAQPLPSLPAGSLEALALGPGGDVAYVDAASLRRMGAVPSRLWGQAATAEWSEYFDGVVAFREEVAPVFEQSR